MVRKVEKNQFNFSSMFRKVQQSKRMARGLASYVSMGLFEQIRFFVLKQNSLGRGSKERGGQILIL